MNDWCYLMRVYDGNELQGLTKVPWVRQHGQHSTTLWVCLLLWLSPCSYQRSDPSYLSDVVETK
jgi:hypothetical protein